MTVSFLATILITLFSLRNISRVPASFVFAVAMFLGAGLPIQFSAVRNIYIDSVTATSILIVFVTSYYGMASGSGSSFTASVRTGRYRLWLLLAAFLYMVPAQIEGEFPLFLAVTEGLFSGNLSREYFTKEVFVYGLYLTIILRFGFMLMAFSIGFSFSGYSKLGKVKTVAVLGIAILSSLVYVQKSNPLFIVLAFFLGQVLSGNLKLRDLARFGLIGLLLLLGTGYILFGAESAFVFVGDMLFRRLTDVPFETLAAHFSFAELYGPQYLKHNFTFLTGNEALPRLIYGHIGGSLTFGWANSLYVGDLVVNFGVVGAFVNSVLLGVFVRIGNKLARMEKVWIGKNIALFSMAAFLLSLSNNALYSGVQVVLSGIFVFFASLSVILTALNKRSG